MTLLVLFLGPALFFLLLDTALDRKAPGWAVTAAEQARDRVRRAVSPTPSPYDPFATLSVQDRLARLSAEIQRLEADPTVFAKAHRIRVARSAYDAVLGEACRLAGVETVQVLDLDAPVPVSPDPARRAREEIELASRGWLW